jgi:hypothetical protein
MYGVAGNLPKPRAGLIATRCQRNAFRPGISEHPQPRSGLFSLVSAVRDSPSAEERGDQADVVVSTILGKTGRALGQALADVATIGILS